MFGNFPPPSNAINAQLKNAAPKNAGPSLRTKSRENEFANSKNDVLHQINSDLNDFGANQEHKPSENVGGYSLFDASPVKSKPKANDFTNSLDDLAMDLGFSMVAQNKSLDPKKTKGFNNDYQPSDSFKNTNKQSDLIDDMFKVKSLQADIDNLPKQEHSALKFQTRSIKNQKPFSHYLDNEKPNKTPSAALQTAVEGIADNDILFDDLAIEPKKLSAKGSGRLRSFGFPSFGNTNNNAVLPELGEKSSKNQAHNFASKDKVNHLPSYMNHPKPDFGRRPLGQYNLGKKKLGSVERNDPWTSPTFDKKDFRKNPRALPGIGTNKAQQSNRCDDMCPCVCRAKQLLYS